MKLLDAAVVAVGVWFTAVGAVVAALCVVQLVRR